MQALIDDACIGTGIWVLYIATDSAGRHAMWVHLLITIYMLIISYPC